MTENLIEKKSWLARLKEGLKKSSSKITQGISTILTHKKLDDQTLADLEELLISADLGPAMSKQLVANLRKNKLNQEITEQEVRTFLAQEIAKSLTPYALPLTIDPQLKPYVVLVVGVNGSGKTTTIGKLAHLYRLRGYQVRMAAGDTFRAAAAQQLMVWGERSRVPVEVMEPGADPASLAYRAYEKAVQSQDDILFIDTAGRLQNKADLMAELSKMRRVLQKNDAQAPHTTLLVLDATIGQNAHNQVEIFQKVAHVDGLIVTKLDGTAKGGVLISLTHTFKLPIHAIGIGEGIDDLRDFEAFAFAESLVGLSS